MRPKRRKRGLKACASSVGDSSKRLRQEPIWATSQGPARLAEVCSTVQRLAILRAHDPKHVVSPTQTDPRGWEWYFLRGLSEPSEHVLGARTSFVDLVEWSRDGKWLASASSDNRQKDDIIRIWNASTGKLYRPLRGHKAPATAIAWHQAEIVSPPGTRTAMSSYGIARQGDARRTLNRGNAPIPALCYSPAGDMLAAAVGDRVCVWDPATGEFRKSLAGHARAVRRIKWNASGKLLATSALFDAVRIWDMASDKPVKIVEHSASWALGAWSPAFAWHARWKNVCLGIVASSGVGCRSGRPGKTAASLCEPHAGRDMIWNSARTAITWLRLVPRRSASGTGAWRRAACPTIRNDRRLARRLCSAAPGRARNARAHSRFRRHRRTNGGYFRRSSGRDLLAALPRAVVPPVCFRRGRSHRAVVDAGRLAPEQARRLEAPRGARLSLGELSARWPDAGSVFLGSTADSACFEVESGKRPRILPLGRGDGSVQSLAWSPDGAILASSSLLPGDLGKGRLILWDVKSATEIGSIGGGARIDESLIQPGWQQTGCPEPSSGLERRRNARLNRRKRDASVDQEDRSQNVRRRKISRSNRSCTSRTTRASSCSLSGSIFQAIASRIMDRCNREKIASKQPALGMPG